MISINVAGTRTDSEKNNTYLKDFDVAYVKGMLTDLIIKRED